MATKKKGTIGVDDDDDVVICFGKDGKDSRWFCRRAFTRLCPTLAKGLRREGKPRGIVLTQLKSGIKIERVD